MLDDLKQIHQRDSEDALGVVEKQWQQLSHDFQVDASRFHDIANIVQAGMGGSAWPAVYTVTWGEPSVPFEIVKDYHLPAYVGPNTLFIASSYSGNTEETLTALGEAEDRGAQIAIVTAGGKLADIAREKGYVFYEIPGGIQPRMSSFFFLAAMIQLLEPLGLVQKGKLAELQSSGDWLKEQITSWGATIPTAQNATKQLAQELIGKSVVVYSGPKMFPAANKFKICMNENAKNVAWVNQFPEFNHNEFIGWTEQPKNKPYGIVEIRSNLENERTQKRFVISEKLLSGMRPAPHVVEPIGETHLQQLLWASNFCDYVSVYIALLNGVDPTPVALVEKLKAELNK